MKYDDMQIFKHQHVCLTNDSRLGHCTQRKTYSARFSLII